MILSLTPQLAGGLLAAALLFGSLAMAEPPSPEPARAGLFQYEATTIDGVRKPLSAYRGQVLLIVNTASRCGYTPQYQGLETLYQRYRDRGLKVLGFPANNFGGQEPGTEAEILSFCQKNYGVSFDLFAKISAKGPDIHPMYRYLTTESGFGGEIRWNFTKFLVDRNGKVVARFESKVDPLSPELIGLVEQALSDPAARQP